MSDITICFVTNNNYREFVKSALFEFPNVNAVFVDEDVICDIHSNPSFRQSIESFVFTDKFRYDTFIQCNDLVLPCHLVPISSNAILESIIKNKIDISCTHLSIDSCFPTVQDHLSRVSFLKDCVIDFLPIIQKDPTVLCNYHLNNVLNNSSFVLTTVPSVLEVMTSKSVPCALIHPIHGDIVNTIERALLSTRSRLRNESNAVVCTISFNTKEYRKTIRLELVQTMIDELTKSLKGYYYEIEDGFNVITNQGNIEHYTQGFKQFRFLDMCQEQSIEKVNVGIGIATTFDIAHKNATRALNLSCINQEYCCYIVRDDQIAYGPISTILPYSNEKFATTITDSKIINLARVGGMSAIYVSKLYDKLVKHQSIHFTAADLAEIENITLRSANRTLLKLSDAGIVEMVGEEKISSKGRPRRVYKINNHIL